MSTNEYEEEVKATGMFARSLSTGSHLYSSAGSFAHYTQQQKQRQQQQQQHQPRIPQPQEHKKQRSSQPSKVQAHQISNNGTRVKGPLYVTIPKTPAHHQGRPVEVARSGVQSSATTPTSPRQVFRVAMVSDFFYPNMGGVEMHIYMLAQCLIKRGNKVIVITHSYGDRKGVRYLTNGLKVYYCPMQPLYQQSGMPTMICGLPLLRNILLREKIDIIHAHQAFSCMANESVVHGSLMGFPTCFTDHSLFGFADASSIHMNKLLKICLSDVDHVICVSNTTKENTVLRAELDPRNVSVIPNAIDHSLFTPDPTARDPTAITFIVMSRLVYRKGIDLLVDVIPAVCKKFARARFIIGGNGPKRLELEEMLEKHQLHDRVEMLGEVQHDQVRNVLVQGDIFINCSLTEAFCMAIVEAASCGLMVVSTKVGGVPEVLPRHILKLAKPKPCDLIDAICEAVIAVKDVVPSRFHEEVKQMYDWNNVAERTEKVYGRISRQRKRGLIERLQRYNTVGRFVGKMFCFVIFILSLYLKLIEWLRPVEDIDIAPDFPSPKRQQQQRLEHDPVPSPSYTYSLPPFPTTPSSYSLPTSPTFRSTPANLMTAFSTLPIASTSLSSPPSTASSSPSSSSSSSFSATSSSFSVSSSSSSSASSSPSISSTSPSTSLSSSLSGLSPPLRSSPSISPGSRSPPTPSPPSSLSSAFPATELSLAGTALSRRTHHSARSRQRTQPHASGR